MKFILTRYEEVVIGKDRVGNEIKVTPGILQFSSNECINGIATIESAWINNARGISCIPPGLYELHPGASHLSDGMGWYDVRIIGGSVVMTGGEADHVGSRYGIKFIGENNGAIGGNISVGESLDKQAMTLVNSVFSLRMISDYVMTDFRKDIGSTLEICIA